MRKVLLIATILALACSVAQAQVLLFEDWETGTDGWVNYGGGPWPVLDNTQNTTPGGTWSIKTNGITSPNYTNALDWNFAAESGKKWVATWNFLDTGATREYLQIHSYSTPPGGGSLQQLISFGVYNAGVDTTKYNFRVAIGSVNWGSTTIARSNNQWHAMRVEHNLDGAGTVSFYVDGVLGAQVTTTAIFGATRIRVGSGLTNGGFGAYYDDIKFEVVPEPASLLALATGLVGLTGFAIRRRRT